MITLGLPRCRFPGRAETSVKNTTSAIAPWDLSETQRLLDNPAVRLLRSPNGAFTLTFLHRAFKEHHAISVPESHMRARLENFLEEVRALLPGSYPQTASDYLATWCGDEQLLLKKLYSDQIEEPVFELTSGAERAMQWIEDLQAKPFVGAESRLELILRNLEEIVLFSTSDVEKRISALREQQADIQTQIDAMVSSNRPRRCGARWNPLHRARIKGFGKSSMRFSRPPSLRGIILPPRMSLLSWWGHLSHLRVLAEAFGNRMRLETCRTTFPSLPIRFSTGRSWTDFGALRT